jgi:hypothetical protein
MNRRAAKHEVLRFGETAMRLGYITEDMLSDALRRQMARVERGESHKLLGLILLELGHIDNQQLIDILREYERQVERAIEV